MRDRKEGRLVASLVALLLVGAALTCAACGGSGGTTAASTPAAPATTSTTAHGAKGSQRASTTGRPVSTTAGKPSRALRAALTVQWRRGRRAGQRTCTGVSGKDALAHFLATAEAAEKRHHVAVRAGMIARIERAAQDGAAREGRARDGGRPRRRRDADQAARGRLRRLHGRAAAQQ